MKSTTRTLLPLGLFAFATTVSAQVASVCPSTGVCFKLNIPESTASSGSGDVFFSISAPSTYEYVALGQGKAMGGSNMFLVYTNSGGTNVTLSPRTANNHNPPTFNSAAQVTLLEGSGVKDGVMTANVRCSNCNTWSGGSMDFKLSSGSWVYAYKGSNGPKNSNDQSASIRQHDERASFSWDWASAKGGNSVNPLIAAAAVVPGSGTGNGGAIATSCIQRNAASATGAGSSSRSGSATTGAPSPSQSSNSNGNNDNADWQSARSRYASQYGSFPTARPSNWPPAKRQSLPYCDEINNSNGNSGNTNSGFRPVGSGGPGGNTRTMLIAHGVLASLAFVILFPSGAIAIRLATFPGIVWIHAAFQVFAYIVYIAAFGLGVYLATEMGLLNSYHPIIGIVVLVALFFQPILGYLHHALFKKHNHRTLWSYGHIWLGRIAITLGIINGGLGLKLADSMHMSSRGGMIAYGVIAGFMWLAWVAASWVGERRKRVARKNAPPKYEERTRHGSGESEVTEVPTEVRGHYAPPK